MATRWQTTVTNDLNIVRGNALLEIAPWIDGNPTWINVGAITELNVEEIMTIGKEENDNAEAVNKVRKQEIQISFNQIEWLKLDVWEALRRGLDTITLESGNTKIQSGNNSTLPYLLVRLTTDNDSNPITFMAYKCQLNSGFNFSYKKDDDEDTRLFNPVEIIGRTDSSRNDFVWEIQGDFLE